MELADVLDSKSSDGNIVRVRLPPPAPKKAARSAAFFLFNNYLYCSTNSLNSSKDFAPTNEVKIFPSESIR